MKLGKEKVFSKFIIILSFIMFPGWVIESTTDMLNLDQV